MIRELDPRTMAEERNEISTFPKRGEEREVKREEGRDAEKGAEENTICYSSGTFTIQVMSDN